MHFVITLKLQMTVIVSVRNEHTFSLQVAMANLSSYAVRMARLSARIFGDVVRPTDSKSMKVVQLFKEPPMAQKKEVYDWYPQHKIYYSLTQKLRYMGLFRQVVFSKHASLVYVTVAFICLLFLFFLSPTEMNTRTLRRRCGVSGSYVEKESPKKEKEREP